MARIGRLVATTMGALLIGSAAVAAQPQEAPTVGETIYDRDGAEVGTIRSVKGDAAVIWTGSVKVTLGLSSFRKTKRGLVIAMTRAQLEAAAAGIQAKGDDEIRLLLTPGANVFDHDGNVAATVDSVTGQDVVLAVGTLKARLPLTAFSKGPKGARLAMSAADLQASIAAQVPPEPPAKAPDNPP